MNNRSLTYVESDKDEQQVLTPNLILWGQNAHVLEAGDDDKEINRMQKQLDLEKTMHGKGGRRSMYMGL